MSTNYRYKALNSSGEIVRGEINAHNSKELLQVVDGQNLRLLSYRKIRKNIFSFSLFKKSFHQDVRLFCVHLIQLDRLQVPLLSSLQDIIESTQSKTMKSVLKNIYQDVSHGTKFSLALKKYPNVFEQEFLQVIAVGEQTGILHKGLSFYVDYLDQKIMSEKEMKQRLRYPTLLFFMILVLVFCLSNFLLPELVKFIDVAHMDRPFLTNALSVFCYFFDNYMDVFLIVLLSFLLIFKIAWKKMEIKTKLPLLGKVFIAKDFLFFSQMMYLMVVSGVQLVVALECSKNLATSVFMECFLKNILLLIKQGKSFSQAVSEQENIPPLVMRFIKIGEDGGGYELTFDHLAKHFQQELREKTNLFLSFLEPFLTTVAGIFLLWIVFGVMMPIYQSFSNNVLMM